jgi:hypothetical protein
MLTRTACGAMPVRVRVERPVRPRHRAAPRASFRLRVCASKLFEQLRRNLCLSDQPPVEREVSPQLGMQDGIEHYREPTKYQLPVIGKTLGECRLR